MLIDALEWLGHSGFRVRAGGALGATIYIDPYRVAGGPKGDLILVTHGHYDHFSPRDVERLVHDRTWLVAAYNTSKRDGGGRAFHPREAGGVGYELNLSGERLYHSGDTDVIPEMDAVAGCDVALLAVSGTYVMTAAEAAEAARRIGPGLAVPMHWGEHMGTRADADEFARLAPVEVRILDRVGG